MRRTPRFAASCWLLFTALVASGLAGSAPDGLSPPSFRTSVYGPYHAEFIAGGSALAKPLAGFDGNATLEPGAAFTLSGWVHVDECPGRRCLLFGIGTPGGGGAYVGLTDSMLAFWTGDESVVTSHTAVADGGEWRFIALTFDGSTARLYADGTEVASHEVHTAAIKPVLQLAPRRLLAADDRPFAGRLATVLVAGSALDAMQIRTAAGQRPAFELINFEAGSPGWSVQTRQMVGQTAPQDAWTLPKSRAPFSAPAAVPVSHNDEPTLKPLDADTYLIGDWRLRPAPDVQATAAQIATAGFDASSWYTAIVPGTVLTTLIARGVYPDPDFGLNNLAIPESLNKQDYWYRTTFVGPALAPGQHARLDFNGINYSATVWVNGRAVGEMRGAFTRGQFDVTGLLRPGEPNVVAVRVSPPPDPGIPHEQSLSAGPGNNGGMQALDGPTFIATEGWDWIPAVRDRNTGLWQDVQLHVSGEVQIGDLQVVTTLPDPHDVATAEVEIGLPLTNRLDRSLTAQVRAEFDDVVVVKSVTLGPGTTNVVLSPAEFPALRVRNPRLWWPNGYGEPALHTLQTSVSTAGHQSDRQVTRFGMRQVSYELSLLDSRGHLRRVELNPSAARGEPLVDVRHAAIRRLTAERFGTWAPTLLPGAERSPAVQPLDDERLTPNMVIRVNGVRIAVRGGNWGMDDWLKRVSRERLEPYFRLHREAHLNTIRNWLGQSTEETFFSLADEYGLLVIDELWASTQNFQLEPQDVPLFLDNAADVIRRFRNHPSIVLWNGRNEGVPQPPLNEGLSRLIAQQDGTRYYSPASLAINLALGGPYSHRPASFYFDYWGNGFTMEVGLPSFPTLEAFKATMAPEDWWPIGDTWAYHDWHAAGNGDTKPFMAAMSTRYGAPSSLEDFERKAQLMNFEAHRAVFEGFNAGLWSRNSGRLLWMTQPAWPSTVWQILSADYDTNAAYYGVKSAAEPVHVQLNLPDWRVAVVNNTQDILRHVRFQAAIHRLDGTRLKLIDGSLDAAAGEVTPGPGLELQPLLDRERAVLVLLVLRDSKGALLSRNLYWLTREDADGKRIAELLAQPVSLSVGKLSYSSENHLHISIRNEGAAPALAIKLTLLKPDGTRILPAYYSDNYVSLLPHESRDIEIAFPGNAHGACTVRGFNVVPTRAVF